MKIINSLFLATLFLVNSFILQSPQQSPELKEATDLTASVVKLHKEGKFDEALPLAKRALEIRERLLPPGDPQILTSLSDLAEVYIARRDYGDARKVLLRMLQIQEQRVGPENIGLALTLDRLALLHRRNRDHSEAEKAYKRALALKEKGYGTDNLEVAHSLLGLAEIHRDHRNFDKAAPMYMRALSIYGKHLGTRSLKFQRAAEAYTCLCYETKQLDKTKDLTEIGKRFAPPDEPKEAPPGMILNGKAVFLAKPDYSIEARAQRLEGLIIVIVEIDETGRVISARDMCLGPRYLSEASVKAAYQSRFSPTKLSGMPVKVNGVIHYNFVRQ